MNTQDSLNILLIVGLLTITSCVLYITYYFVKALKTIINLANNIEEVTQEIKGKVGFRTLTIIPAVLITLLGRFLKKRG